MRDRGIALKGTYNVRDLGGYSTLEGKSTRWSRLLRGGNTWDLPKEDVEVLLSYGLESVIDLRHEEEALNWPSVFRDRTDVHYENISLRSGELWQAFQSDGGGGGMAGWYIFFIERAQKEIGAALTALCNRVLDGCTLIHCNAGKDRTGVTAAIALRTLNVPVETIAEDYALSWQYLQPVREKLQREAFEKGEDPKAALRGWSANPETMTTTLDHIESRHGGIVAYLDSIGVDDSSRKNLRESMLE